MYQIVVLIINQANTTMTDNIVNIMLVVESPNIYWSVVVCCICSEEYFDIWYFDGSDTANDVTLNSFYKFSIVSWQHPALMCLLFMDQESQNIIIY